MNLEMVCLGEALVAVLAAKWQLDRVGRIVISQFVEICVAFPANAAIQWIVLLVNLHMILDMALLDERLVAHVTPIGSFVIVDPYVIDQVDLLDEANAADQTLVRSLAGVDLRVI